jgi:nucleotidyltransferase substrate binding protein (TIGR01987 family)
MQLDFSSLQKALAQLEKAFTRSQNNTSDEELRDACIQRFEYSFELSWKMLKKQIEKEVGSSADIDTYSKKQLFRVGGERGLIEKVEAWFEYLEKRNKVAHTYDLENANDVYAVIGGFIKDAQCLLTKLNERHED